MSVNSKTPVKIPYYGTYLLDIPLLNKGAGFSEEERTALKLHGLVPYVYESIEEQMVRVSIQYKQNKDDMEKHVFLRNLQDRNETLFYHFVRHHLEEVLPVIYTPTVGEACQYFSAIYRSPRGVFISYPNRHLMDEMLANVTKKNVKVIVVTDGERILGLGDQGIGGMGISIGKLSLYTSCGGVSPAYTLPIVLDVGTNNDLLLNDPLYLGWKNKRITGAEYEEFVDLFIKAVKRRWPNVLLQFEDFAQKNAQPILQRYRKEICCFNDDIQGTAAVTLGTLLAAVRARKEKLSEQRLVFLGAGSAGAGIAEMIVAYMKSEGLTDAQARAQIYMVDRYGLITDKMPSLLDFQKALAQKSESLSWVKVGEDVSLLETVKNVKPTILVGVSAQPGLFTEEIIKTMYTHCKKPIIMPLSNPTSRIEAHPENIIRWTEGHALVATGSPFLPIQYNEKLYPIAQCNNSYIFPGIGLGVISSGAREVTEGMLMAASEALADMAPINEDSTGKLLPELAGIEKVSRYIAFKVGLEAIKNGVALKMTTGELQAAIEENFWIPEYRTYIPK